MSTGPEVKFGISEAKGLVDGALQAVQKLRQSYIAVKLQPEVLQGFNSELRIIQAKFSQLSNYRLKTPAAKTAVLGLLDAVKEVLEMLQPELQQQQQQQSTSQQQQSILKHLWQALCVCLCGLSELTNRLQLWQDKIRKALESVEKEKDNLQPQLSPLLLESLPEPCVTNHGTLQEAVNAIKEAAARSVTQTVTAAGPPVVQLLGMGGMGKSVLALQVALKLDKGVYAEHVPDTVNVNHTALVVNRLQL